MDDGVDGPGLERDVVAELPDVVEPGEVAREGRDAVARLLCCRLDPLLIGTHRDDPVPGRAEGARDRNPGGSAAACDEDGEGRKRAGGSAHSAELPVMPAVDSMTGRIFFSKAS